VTQPTIDDAARKVIAEHAGHLDKLIDVYRQMKAKDAADGIVSTDSTLGGITMALEMLPSQMRLLIAALAIQRLAEDVTR